MSSDLCEELLRHEIVSNNDPKEESKPRDVVKTIEYCIESLHHYGVLYRLAIHDIFQDAVNDLANHHALSTEKKAKLFHYMSNVVFGLRERNDASIAFEISESGTVTYSLVEAVSSTIDAQISFARDRVAGSIEYVFKDNPGVDRAIDEAEKAVRLLRPELTKEELETLVA